ncbi:MAG: alkaline phosphatase family protein [Sandaracinaceae bacterium]
MFRHTVAASTIAIFLAACSEDPVPDAGTPPTDAGTPPPPTDAGGPPGYDAGPIARIPESEAAANRTACAYGPGAFPAETIGEEYPIGDDIPIERFILLMQENRSFDHYFGTMPGVEGIPAEASNPDAMGNPVVPFHTDAYCVEDVSHSWNGSHRQYNGGAMDGFVVTNDPMGERAMGYLDGSDLPFYWNLAQTFAFSDHHHCSVLGPTMVNREFYMGGSSVGRTTNGAIDDSRVSGEYNVFMELDRVGIEWRVYYESVPAIWGAYPGYALHPRRRDRARPIEELWDDLAAGDLPPVVYVDPRFEAAGDRTVATDEHPPANPQFGQAWVRQLVTAVMASPIWRETAVVFTYDEHGGFYDHVPPPDACGPGDYPPDGAGDFAADEFERYGFRVPLTVISPWSRAGYVSDRVTDGTSILRLVQARFGLPAITGRDANAWPLLDMFDFDDPPFMDPPTLVEAPIDEAPRMRCTEAFPGGGIEI